MTDSIIDKAASVMADDWNPDRDPVLTAMFRDYAKSLYDASLLSPEIDGAMIERASKVLWEHPDFPGTWQELSSNARMTYRNLARAALEAALGGEQ